MVQHLVQFRARSHSGLMDYDEACKMHLTPGVVHNFLKAGGVQDFCPLFTKRSQIPIRKKKGATLGILDSSLNNRWEYTTPGLCGRTATVKHRTKKEKKL